MEIWVLVVEYGSECIIYAHTSEEGAVNSLHDYVKEWWEDEMSDIDTGKTPAIPKDLNEATDMYFERVENEWYSLQQVRLED